MEQSHAAAQFVLEGASVIIGLAMAVALAMEVELRAADVKLLLP